MSPTTFHSATNANAEAEFRAWHSENPDGFYINQRTNGRGMLPRTDCWHVGA